MKECWNIKKNGNLFHTDDNRIFNSHAIEWANKPSQSDSMTVFINWTIQNVILNWPITLWRHNFHFNVEILIIVCSKKKKKRVFFVMENVHFHTKISFWHENFFHYCTKKINFQVVICMVKSTEKPSSNNL